MTDTTRTTKRLAFIAKLRCHMRRPRDSAITLADGNIDMPVRSSGAPIRKSWRAWISIGALFALGLYLLARAGSWKHGDAVWLYVDADFQRNFAEHLGMALIIGAIAGLGYEIFAHHKQLEQQLHILININDQIASSQLKHVLAKLVHVKSGDDRVHRDLRKHLSSIIASIAKMDEAAVGADLISLRFISTLLRYADNASRTLSTDDHREGQNVLVLPRTAADLADEILAEHVHALEYGGSYDVISDFSTWQGWRLDKFSDELDRKLTKHKCFVRRVFCVFPHDIRLTPDEAKGILLKHWEWALRIAAATGEPHYNVAFSLLQPIEHVGIFTQKHGVMCFKPQGEGDLARLVISHSADRERLEVKRHWETGVRVFESIRKAALPLTFEDCLKRLQCVSGEDAFFEAHFKGRWRYSDSEVPEWTARCLENPTARLDARLEQP